MSVDLTKLGLHVLVNGTRPVADIVAVHGLAAHPLYTWTKKAGGSSGSGTSIAYSKGEDDRVMWLQDLLPSVIPDARILAYSHDSRYLKNASKESLRSIAAGLVTALHDLRNSEPETVSRPIVFLGHSFGGIVIEEALLYAHHRENYRYLAFCTCGVVFLGTPHRGSNAASWGKIVAQAAKALGSDTRILETLEKGSDRLESVIDDFTTMARQIGMTLVCFYELLETEYGYRHISLVKTMVVEKSSAIIDGYESIPLSLDHSALNKYGSAEEEGFQLISSRLKELVITSQEFLSKNVPGTLAAKSPSTAQVVDIASGAQLPVAAEAVFNSANRQHDPLCLPDTRVDLLDEIYKWSVETLPGSRTIYWLCGMAGTGKSTIARTVATTCHTQGRLAASFLFSRGNDDLSSSRKFVTTIAFQLSYALPEPIIKQRIANAIKNNPNIVNSGLYEQWSQLVLQPLSSAGLEGSSILSKPFVLLIDALDECDNEDDIGLIIHLFESLNAQSESLGIQFRVFVTSRPEVPIRLGFKAISKESHHDFILHDIDEAIVQKDISRFLSHELQKIKVNSTYDLPSDWPGSDSIHILAQRAGTLFIYAATTSRFIGDRKFDPRKRLSVILETDIAYNSTTGSLDSMYAKILEQSVAGGHDNQDSKELLKRFRTVIGPIVLLFDALSIHGLAALLNIDESVVEGTLADLGSVIDTAKGHKIRLLHPSFRDFLLDPSRCRNSDFQINWQKTHHAIFLNCLRLISTHLRRDICGLQRPGISRSEIHHDVIEKNLPLHVLYACQHWVSHLHQATMERGFSDNTFNPLSDDTVGAILKFLKVDFLHWQEALSLGNRVSEGCSAIATLEDIVRARIGTEFWGWKAGTRSRADKELISIVYDAKRFMFRNAAMIEKAPLQTYCGALFFCPVKTKVLEYFRSKIPPWVTSSFRSTLQVPDYWDPLVNICEGHLNRVTAIAFTPDGKMLASASTDKAVKIWDSQTGACQKTLVGHTDSVRAVSFSPSGGLLASASWDQTIKIWDPITGACRETIEGHFSRVNVVAFSPDGRLLASASANHVIKTWNPKTGACQNTMQGHSRWINAVTFSPDAKLLVSAAWDKTMKIWDPNTGACLKTIDGHTSWVYAVAFSLDGTLLASASNDKTVRVWDSKTGACQKILKGHSSDVIAVAFSPEGKRLVSASHDQTVRIWKLKTGVCQETIEAHSSHVTTVVFSPDGKFLASASSDTTVKFWDLFVESKEYSWITSRGRSTIARLISKRTSKRGHSDVVRDVAFSPDGKLLASASEDCNVGLWDPNTGLCQKIMEGHEGSVIAVSFSPDAKHLASASSDTTIRIWDPKKGACQYTLKGHSYGITAIAFSLDGTQLVSASYDDTIKIWDLKTGKCIKTIQYNTYHEIAIAFSPDGKLLASGSPNYINGVAIWDTKTGECEKYLAGHSNSVRAVAFSPDGKFLVSAAEDMTLRIWDYITGDCKKVFHCQYERLPDSRVAHERFTVSDVVVIVEFSPGVIRIHFDSTRIPIADDWIGWKDEKLFWLPRDPIWPMRQCYDSRNNFLAMGFESGAVCFFEFRMGSLRCTV